MTENTMITQVRIQRREKFIEDWPKHIPFGRCQCGCGHTTPLATKDRKGNGNCEGLPTRYCNGHAPTTCHPAQPCKPMPHERTDGTPMYEIDSITGCWNWTAALSNNGYGRVGWHGKLHQAHRVTYEFLRGPVPKGMDLDHLCRNRKCVNPDHLEPVTRAVNARRGARSKLTMEQVEEIRQRFAAGGITQVALGEEYGVDGSIVCEIVNCKIWIAV